MKLRSKKVYASPKICVVAEDVESKRRRRNEKKRTTTTIEVEIENEDVVVAKQIEKQQQKKRRGLPDELWDKIFESVDDNNVTAFASVCKQLRRVQQRSGRELKTDMTSYSISSERYVYDIEYKKKNCLRTVSKEWCLWTMSFLSEERQQEQRRQVVNAAAFSGHLGALKYWKEQTRAKKGLVDEETCAFAALGGQMEVLVWLRETNCPWDERTCMCAAYGGHLDVLKYAQEHRCPWDELTCAGAASRGHLEVLKYLHENGCPWDEKTCEAAAVGGDYHLDVLEYARANGCPEFGEDDFEHWW